MMRKICITQRVDLVESCGERRDALDQNWARLISELEAVCLPLPNHPISAANLLNFLHPNGLILSGGNDLASLGSSASSAPERDAFEIAALEWAKANGTPVLGVCRGFQMINVYLGGQLKQAARHVACRHPIEINNTFLALDLPNNVNSFHNYVIDTNELAQGLIALAVAPDGTVEACRHHDLPWYGIMWHPEREKPFQRSDLTLLRTIFSLSS